MTALKRFHLATENKKKTLTKDVYHGRPRNTDWIWVGGKDLELVNNSRKDLELVNNEVVMTLNHLHGQRPKVEIRNKIANSMS